MYGDEFKCTFSAFEWNNILRMFVNEVKEKRYDKLDYDLWRELREISESMETWDLVRVYWNNDYDHWIPVNVYIDSKANGKPDMPFEFDSGDGTFGSFLYELELYREEKDQMRVKESYYTDAEGREWQTYDRYPVKGYYLDSDLELLKSSSSLGVSCLDDRADVVCDTLATKADVTSLNSIEDKVNILAADAAAAAPMKNTINNKKENNVMKFNFDFGPVNPATVRMSLEVLSSTCYLTTLEYDNGSNLNYSLCVEVLNGELNSYVSLNLAVVQSQNLRSAYYVYIILVLSHLLVAVTTRKCENCNCEHSAHLEYSLHRCQKNFVSK